MGFKHCDRSIGKIYKHILKRALYNSHYVTLRWFSLINFYAVSEKRSNWRIIRTLNVLEDFNREGLGTEVGFWLLIERLVRSRNRIIVRQAFIVRVDSSHKYQR